MDGDSARRLRQLAWLLRAAKTAQPVGCLEQPGERSCRCLCAGYVTNAVSVRAGNDVDVSRVEGDGHTLLLYHNLVRSGSRNP
jgi:hypothetical protein